MSHPTEETLLAWIDGELEPTVSDDVARHVARCGACAAAAEHQREATRQFAGVLAGVDAFEPSGWEPAAAAVAAAAGPADAGVIRLDERAARRRTERHRAAGASVWRWAAGIVLVAGGASAAVLGGQRLFRADAPTGDVEVLRAPARAVDDAAAVSVQPRAGSVTIALAGAGAGSRVDIVLEARADARVTVTGVAAPHFSAAAGTIEADLHGGTVVVRVALPRDLPAGVVTLDGQRVATVRNGVVTRQARSGGVEVNVSAAQPMN